MTTEELFTKIMEVGRGQQTHPSASAAIAARHRYYRERKKLIGLNPDFNYIAITCDGPTLTFTYSPPPPVELADGQTLTHGDFASELARLIGVTTDGE